MESAPVPEVTQEQKVAAARNVERLTRELDQAIREAIASGLEVALTAYSLGYREMLVAQVTEVKYLTQRIYGYPEFKNILVTDHDDEAGPEGPEKVALLYEGEGSLVDGKNELEAKTHRLK